MSVYLYHGDYYDVLESFPDNSIDLIYTDPPYPKQYLPAYVNMAEVASRKLKIGGSLVSVLPHYAINTLVRPMSEYLKWRWMCSMWQMQDSHSRMAMGIEVVWKPIGWWVKKAWPTKRGFVKDGFENRARDKNLHEWQQNEDWALYAHEFVKMIDNPVIVDPFFGSGTLGILSNVYGYEIHGIDYDEKAVSIVEERFNIKRQMYPSYIVFGKE